MIIQKQENWSTITSKLNKNKTIQNGQKVSVLDFATMKYVEGTIIGLRMSEGLEHQGKVEILLANGVIITEQFWQWNKYIRIID